MSSFERKFGKYAIQNLSFVLVLCYAVGYLLQMFDRSGTLILYLTLNPYAILHGQVWRLFTWILIPPESSNIFFTLLMLYFYCSIGTTLERTWGTYRYNVYLFQGMLFTIAGSFLLMGFQYLFNRDMIAGLGADYYFLITSLYFSTYYINMSIFLAYAFTYPEEQLMLYFIIPVRIKWFGYLYVAYLVYDIIKAFKTGSIVIGIIITVLIFVSLLNFLIYIVFGKNKARFNPKQIKRRQQYKQSIKRAAPTIKYENGARHKCAVCGRTELDDPNLTFRYCSKCSGNKEYCQDHLFTHEHH